VEWRLFKASVASSAARGRLFGWKQVVVANNGKKATPWWNQEVKDAVQEKKEAYIGMAS